MEPRILSGNRDYYHDVIFEIDGQRRPDKLLTADCRCLLPLPATQ